MISINNTNLKISINELQNLKEMGFSETQIISAYKKSMSTKQSLLDVLLD